MRGSLETFYGFASNASLTSMEDIDLVKKYIHETPPPDAVLIVFEDMQALQTTAEELIHGLSKEGILIMENSLGHLLSWRVSNIVKEQGNVKSNTD